jgi:diguanylate cyclase (GGDEF)-like protein
VVGVVNTAARGASSGRSLFARFRRRRPNGAAVPQAAARFSASKSIAVLAVLAVGATALSAAIGYDVAHRSDESLWAEQRTSLRNAISEFRALFGQSGQLDPRFIRMVEQSTGLQHLKFEAEPEPNNREMQPVLDGQGRIAGFFTWEKTHPATGTMDRLMPLIAGIDILLIGFAGFSLWHLRRARRDLNASEQLAAQAGDFDKLTGLPNHAKALELLDLMLSERADNEITTFALIELDGMSDVVADLGVLGGDELIVSVANRLREALPPHARCGRIGSDEFAVTFSADNSADAEATIRGIVDAVVRPHWIDTVVRINAHAGFAQTPGHATTRGELTRRAELALRAAVKKGPGTVVAFTPAIDTVSTDQKFIQRELPRALSAGDLELHYQPIVAAQGGRIVGVEALLRWTHATRGPIGPAIFIPVAEQMGLMDSLGAFVLRRALKEAKRWPELYVAVNLSPLQVRDRAIVDLVRSALADSGVPPSRLMLEITEGVLIDNPEEMVKRIEDLHALGVRIALDDFGSGYSNLGYLQRFPLDKLKIDRSFVIALGNSANGGVIIQAIVALGRALGLSGLVEGVETEQQRVLLRLAGCDEMQGFLFARPAPATTIDRLLEQAKRSARAPMPPEALTG